MSEHGCLPPRRTGRADFPHPALTQTLTAGQYAGPSPLSRAAQPGSQMRTVPQPHDRFFRIGTFVQAEFPSSYPDMSAPRPLRSTVITRFSATMSRSDSRPGPLLGLFIPPARWTSLRPPRRVSQVPRLICPRALSPATPEGPAAALAPCFTASVRLHPQGRTGHLQVPLTRPNRVHLRYGSRVRLARLRRTNYSVSRSLGYLSNGQLQGKLLSAYKISQAFPGTPLKGRDTNHRPVRTRGRPVFPPLQG
jgi:hypothetical protein